MTTTAIINKVELDRPNKQIAEMEGKGCPVDIVLRHNIAHLVMNTDAKPSLD